jgi:hypothetical protein
VDLVGRHTDAGFSSPHLETSRKTRALAGAPPQLE